MSSIVVDVDPVPAFLTVDQLDSLAGMVFVKATTAMGHRVIVIGQNYPSVFLKSGLANRATINLKCFIFKVSSLLQDLNKGDQTSLVILPTTTYSVNEIDSAIMLVSVSDDSYVDAIHSIKTSI